MIIFPRSLWHYQVKRCVDVVGSVLCAIVLSPIFLVVLFLLWREGRPVFFSQPRVGQDGSIFSCWKFRTMVPDAELRLAAYLEATPSAAAEWRAHHKLREDPRITPLGHWLRRLSIDELPQLWNVFVGDMSLIGPRPVTAEELVRYGDSASYYCAMRPGMTGLWQVMGRSALSYEERVLLDRRYVEEWSLGLDLWIAWRTIPAVLTMHGSH